MQTSSLRFLKGFPTALLDCEPQDLHRYLTGPTLIEIAGKRPDPLFVSVLLHGNEGTGWLAVRELIRHSHQVDPLLPRPLILLVGNVAAAAANVRHLPDQLDYNRIWLPGSAPEQEMAAQVLDYLTSKSLFAAIDIHNNTGRNPHYACVNRLDPAFLQLAVLFGPTVIYFTRPDGVLSKALAPLCPAVVLECGKPDQPHGVAHALQFLKDCLHLDHLPERPVAPQDIQLFHTVATVKVPPQVSFDFGEDRSDLDLCFPNRLDQLNFQELPAHTRFAWIRDGMQLDVRNEDGEEVSKSFFYQQDGQLLTSVAIMPSMLTLNQEIIRQDCLCYLMERYPQ